MVNAYPVKASRTPHTATTDKCNSPLIHPGFNSQARTNLTPITLSPTLLTPDQLTRDQVNNSLRPTLMTPDQLRPGPRSILPPPLTTKRMIPQSLELDSSSDSSQQTIKTRPRSHTLTEDPREPLTDRDEHTINPEPGRLFNFLPITRESTSGSDSTTTTEERKKMRQEQKTPPLQTQDFEFKTGDRTTPETEQIAGQETQEREETSASDSSDDPSQTSSPGKETGKTKHTKWPAGTYIRRLASRLSRLIHYRRSPGARVAANRTADTETTDQSGESNSDPTDSTTLIILSGNDLQQAFASLQISTDEPSQSGLQKEEQTASRDSRNLELVD